MTAPAARTRSRVTVLIVNYNGWRDTVECLDSLYRSDYPLMRVLVLDNASTNDSAARIAEWIADRAPQFPSHEPPELVRLGANLGFAGANNVGLRRMLDDAQSRFAWLLNGDAVVAPQTLSRLVGIAEADGGVGMVGSKILRYDAPDLLETAGGGTLSMWNGTSRPVRAGTARTSSWPDPPRLDYVAGTSVLVTREAIQRAGLMDERYFLYSEDADWSIQVRRSGLRLAYCDDAEVWHKRGGSTVHRSAVHDYHTVRSALLFVRKMRPALLPLALAYSLWRFVLPKIVRRQWSRLKAVGRAYRDFARNRELRTAGRR